MAFEFFTKPPAKKDLFKAISYDIKIDGELAGKFYAEFINLNNLLKTNPHFAAKYNNIRTCKLKSFRYLRQFIIDENVMAVTIIAIVFGKRGRTNFAYRSFDL